MKKTWFEVWALGTSEDIFDAEEYLGEFDRVEDAIEFANSFADMSYVYGEEILADISEDATMEIRVEKVHEPAFDVCECIGIPYSFEIKMPGKPY